MKKREIESRTEELLKPIEKENRVMIYDVEYVKEAGEYYLRIFLDKEGGVDINDCVAVNIALSDALDVEDYIDDQYTLEVSSKGLGRKLTKDRHLEHEIGNSIDVKLYAAVDDQKIFTGKLVSFDKENIVMDIGGEKRAFNRKDISGIKLTLDI